MQNLNDQEQPSKVRPSAELFDHTVINTMNLANRFVRSATWEGLADKDGFVTKKLNDMMVELAKGGVGLIISGYTFISPEGQSSPRQMTVCTDKCEPGLREMTAAVHAVGGKIAMQLVHGGCNADPVLTGLELIGPSTVQKEDQSSCRSAGKADIAAMVSAFTEGAKRAQKTGFDAVQLHAAHGFLISQFLSPAFNQRTDEYGGNIVNRARFLLEVVASVRKAVGPEYPILIKLNSEDFLDGGMTRDEAIQVSTMLENASVDAIEFSGGTVASPEELIAPRPGHLTPAKEVYYRDAAKLYKQKVSIPLILVGGIRSYEVAEKLVSSDLADYISLSRPLICEPNLIKRWHDGDQRAAECVSDNACFGPALDGSGVSCVTYAKKRSK